MISDLMEKVLLLGVGAASLTKEKIDELTDELVKRGQMTREEGEQFVREATDRAREGGASIKEMASDTYQDTLRALGLAPREELEELERRLTVLEAKVYGKPLRVEEPQTGFVITETEEVEPT